MNRKTKIVATMGPATDQPGVLERLIAAGVDVFRINFSHGKTAEHAERIVQAREIAGRLGRDVGILCDLQGPKIRIENFADGAVELVEGRPFTLDTALGTAAGDVTMVGCAYQQLPQDVAAGDVLLLNDGAIALRVDTVDGSRVHCVVTQGGTLSGRKGINKLGGGLSAPALTDEDLANIRHAAEWNADFLAVSFPRTAADITRARELLQAAGGDAWIVAKIERAEALENLEDILRAADVAMVARGDLGVEIGEAELPGVQKRIITLSRELNRAVITATQMMESMITQPIPTRAEVLDVANAVIDGTDAVMLSAETAVGDYPTEAVEAMVRICMGAEKHPSMHQSKHRIHESMEHVDEAIALSAMYAANHLDGVTSIICMSETGATPLLMSRIKSSLPIFAFSRNHSTQHRVTMFRGVQTVPFDSATIPPEQTNSRAVAELVRMGAVKEGDLVVITKGDYVNAQGGTNTMKIVRVGADIR